MKLQAHVDAELSQAQLEELARRLAEKRGELVQRVANLEQQIVSKDDCSLADAADAVPFEFLVFVSHCSATFLKRRRRRLQ